MIQECWQNMGVLMTDAILLLYREANKCGWLLAFNTCVAGAAAASNEKAYDLVDTAEKLSAFVTVGCNWVLVIVRRSSLRCIFCSAT